jgi:putative tryptophan/tyrosine transport system substrate-binding protein
VRAPSASLWIWIAALGSLLAGLATASSATAQTPVVGILSFSTASGHSTAAYREAFEQQLAELGWLPGRSVRLEYRYAEGRPERLTALAQELVGLRVDVIVARSTPAIRAAKQATARIPIVMSASGADPIASGFIASLARPGGNVTGLALLNRELQTKQLQLLKEAVPRLSRVAVVGGTVELPAKERHDLDTAAAGMDLQLRYVAVPRVSDLDATFAELARARVGALLVRADPGVLEPNTPRVVALAAKHRLPAVYWLQSYPAAGGLMSYGADLIAVHRRSAFYVDRLLRGARPTDLPVEEPAKLSLIVNLKAAAAIGLTFPPSLLGRADETLD